MTGLWSYDRFDLTIFFKMNRFFYQLLLLTIVLLSECFGHRHHHFHARSTSAPITTTTSPLTLSTVNSLAENINREHRHVASRRVTGRISTSFTTSPSVSLPAPSASDALSVVDSDVGYTNYNKLQPGRHVCTTQREVSQPVKTVEAWCKPSYKQYTQLCNKNQICHGVRLVYEKAYRDVMKTKTTKQITYVCCPGWTQANKNSHGCNTPVCTVSCRNGGTCIRPDHCSCPKGFRGKYCEMDINECKEQKPCDHICHNTVGSFRCQCRENFYLLPDGQSCKKEGGDGPAFEARDLEFDDLSTRLSKLEKLIGSNDLSHNQTEIIPNMKKSVNLLSTEMHHLKNRVDFVERSHHDIKLVRDRLVYLEQRTNKILEKLLYNRRGVY